MKATAQPIIPTTREKLLIFKIETEQKSIGNDDAMKKTFVNLSVRRASIMFHVIVFLH